jgi:hypothetical protein
MLFRYRNLEKDIGASIFQTHQKLMSMIHDIFTMIIDQELSDDNHQPASLA